MGGLFLGRGGVSEGGGGGEQAKGKSWYFAPSPTKIIARPIFLRLCITPMGSILEFKENSDGLQYF